MNAIPTIYKGIRFRSRLEAKWACFFDTIMLEWQYEPFDLAGWIPDFSIRGQCFVRTSVEVKPNFDYLPEVKTKILKSVLATPEYHDSSLLILGNGPAIYDGCWPIFGHFTYNNWDACPCEWKEIRKCKEGGKNPKVNHVPLPIEESWFEWCDINLREPPPSVTVVPLLSTDCDWNEIGFDEQDYQHSRLAARKSCALASAFWAHACNETQWMPNRA